MAKAAYLDITCGIAGDMFLGALIDAGCSEQDLMNGLRSLPIASEFDLVARRVRRGALMGTHVEVVVHHDHGHTGPLEHAHGRSYFAIARMIRESDLPDLVKENALAVFLRIGEAEARLHGSTLEEIHFHEVGAVDSIVDIVGVCLGLHLMSITSVFSSPVTDGHGTLKCDHGIMPVPAPATLELLKGVPLLSCDIPKELVTPTGAALLTHFSQSFGTRPPMIVDSVGYGAGSRNLPQRPNLVRISIGELLPPTPRVPDAQADEEALDRHPHGHSHHDHSHHDHGDHDHGHHHDSHDHEGHSEPQNGHSQDDERDRSIVHDHHHGGHEAHHDTVS